MLAFAAGTGLVGLIGRAAYGAMAGVIAAAAFAVAPLAVQNAHFGRVDLLALALMALAMWIGGRAQSRFGWAVAGIAAGLAGGTKYTWGLVAVLYLLVLLRRGADSARWLRRLHRRRAARLPPCAWLQPGTRSSWSTGSCSWPGGALGALRPAPSASTTT